MLIVTKPMMAGIKMKVQIEKAGKGLCLINKTTK